MRKGVDPAKSGAQECARVRYLCSGINQQQAILIKALRALASDGYKTAQFAACLAQPPRNV